MQTENVFDKVAAAAEMTDRDKVESITLAAIETICIDPPPQRSRKLASQLPRDKYRWTARRSQAKSRQPVHCAKGAIMTKDHGKSVKNDDQYEALREDGASKEKAARIANTRNAGKKGGRADAYEQWTRDALYGKAAEVGIKGRSKMNKNELKQALRSH